MEGVLGGNGPLTVFAPNNGAFGTMDRDYLLLLVSSPAYRLHAVEIAQLQLSQQYFPITNLVVGQEFDTFLQTFGMIAVGSDESGLFLAPTTEPAARVRIADPDIYATNGVLHVTDGVFFPQYVSLNPLSFLTQASFHGADQMHTFLALVVASDLDTKLRLAEDVTLFVPVNNAIPDELFDFLVDPANMGYLQQVINYHIVPQVINFENLSPSEPTVFVTVQGEEIQMSQRSVVYANGAVVLDFGLVQRGIVYQLDSILLPPFNPMAPPESSTESPLLNETLDETRSEPIDLEIPTLNDLMIMEGLQSFSLVPENHTLLSQLPAAIELFASSTTPAGNFTVFLPNTRALATMTSEYRVNLSSPGFGLHLLTLLAFHATSSALDSMALLQQGKIEMLTGDAIDITGSRYGVYVNTGARFPARVLLSAPVETVGTVHVVNRMLLPPWTKIPDHVAALARIPTFSSFLSLLVGTGVDTMLLSHVSATVIAPDNTALPEELVSHLLSPGREALARSIALYHIIPRLSTHLMAVEQGDHMTVQTLQGLTITLDIVDGNHVMAANQTELVGYSLTSQGVVYRSNRILIPPAAHRYVPSTLLPQVIRSNVPLLSGFEFPMVLPRR